MVVTRGGAGLAAKANLCHKGPTLLTRFFSRLLILLVISPLLLLSAQATLTARVATDIGGEMDDPAHEISRASSAVRTGDGRFVVGNGRPLAVRVYDAAGRFVRNLGRAGEGPGEFRGDALVLPWSGDSVLTFSAGTRRWMLFSLSGNLIREWPLEGNASPASVTILGSAFARNLFGEGVRCAAALIRRLVPGTARGFREAMVDGAGRVWLRDMGAVTWQVHDRTGRQVASVAFPPGFTVTHLTADLAVGVASDEDGFQHVITTRPGLPPQPAVRQMDCAVPPLPVTDARAAEVRAGIRNAMTAAEMHYSQHARYPDDIKAFGRNLELPRGIDGQMLYGTDRGFAVMIRDIATGWRCVVSVGDAFAGWPDGVYACGN